MEWGSDVMLNCTIDSFVVNNMKEVNQRLKDDYLSSEVIINIQAIGGDKLKVFYHKPKDWNLINCFVELPEGAKKKYGVTN